MVQVKILSIKIGVLCPECGAEFKVDAKSAKNAHGAVQLAKVVRCPHCLKNLYPGRIVSVARR